MFAKGDISNSDVAAGSGLVGGCELITGPLNDQIDFNTAALPGFLPEIPVVMQEPLPAAANNGTVTVSCESSGTTPSASHVVITATRVGSLTFH